MASLTGSARNSFREIMAERRGLAVGTPDHSYRTRAARAMIWFWLGIPPQDWAAMQQGFGS